MDKDLITKSREQLDTVDAIKDIKETTGYGTLLVTVEAGMVKGLDMHYTDRLPAKVHYKPENSSITA